MPPFGSFAQGPQGRARRNRFLARGHPTRRVSVVPLVRRGCRAQCQECRARALAVRCLPLLAREG
eukprot:10226132-Alexandrium_andersonii.AAC.1